MGPHTGARQMILNHSRQLPKIPMGCRGGRKIPMHVVWVARSKKNYTKSYSKGITQRQGETEDVRERRLRAGHEPVVLR